MSRYVLFYVLLQYVPIYIFSAKTDNSISVVDGSCENFDMDVLEEYILRLNLSNIPTIEVMAAGFKCPVTALPFGALKSDWSRLLMLYNAQSGETDFKPKLRRLFRLLVVAYYQMEETFNVSTQSNTTYEKRGENKRKTTISWNDIDFTEKSERDSSNKSFALPTAAKGTYLAKHGAVNNSGSCAPITFEENRNNVKKEYSKKVVSSASESDSNITEVNKWLESNDSNSIDQVENGYEKFEKKKEFLTTTLTSLIQTNRTYSNDIVTENVSSNSCDQSGNVTSIFKNTILEDKANEIAGINVNVIEYSVEETSTYPPFTQMYPAISITYNKKLSAKVEREEAGRTTIKTSDFRSTMIDNTSGDRYDFPQGNNVFGVYEHKPQVSKPTYTVDPFPRKKFDRKGSNKIKRPYVLWKPSFSKNNWPFGYDKPSSLPANAYHPRPAVYPHIQGQVDSKPSRGFVGSNRRRMDSLGHEKRAGSNTNIRKLFRWFYRQGQRSGKNNLRNSMSERKQEERIECKNEE